MRLVLEALRECPILGPAAAKAGIHPKTLAYWLKRSEAGDDGYDLEWQDVFWRFHELCKSAIDQAYDTVLCLLRQKGLGIRYKTDPSLVKLGYRGIDAYATDENGDWIEETVGRPNLKYLQLYLEIMRPEKWGKRSRKGGVLVIGGPKKSESACAASIKARKWKAASKMLQQTEA